MSEQKGVKEVCDKVSWYWLFIIVLCQRDGVSLIAISKNLTKLNARKAVFDLESMELFYVYLLVWLIASFSSC